MARVIRRVCGGLASIGFGLALAAIGGSAAGESQAARDLALRGRRLMEDGDAPASLQAFRSARAAWETAVPRDADLADFLALHLHNLGVQLNNAGDPDRALECFVEALRLARETEGRLRDASFRRSLADGALQIAAFLVASGRTDLPLQAYRLVDDPPFKDVRGTLGLGSALLARGDPAAALAAYERAATAQPDAAEPEAGRGRALLLLARQAGPDERWPLLERAAEFLRRARDREPGSGVRRRELAAALVELGAAAARSGEVAAGIAVEAEADREFRRAVELEPDSPWPALDLANRLLRTRRYEEAARGFERASSLLEAMLAREPAGAGATAWRAAIEASRQNRSTSLFNLAIDAVNSAEFQRVEPLLQAAAQGGAAWERRCGDLREAARKREAAFRDTVKAHETALASEPDRAASLLALGDLFAAAGRYDRALEYYRRLGTNGPPDLADRIAAVSDPGPLEARVERVDIPGARVEVRRFREKTDPELLRALKAAWLRVTAVLGEDAMRGSLLVTMYPNRRAFRENAGYRVGSMVTGFYGAGQVSFFETPSSTALEWVAVLTHELSHHAVERLSGGRAPWWLSEGIARYVEGDLSLVDRGRLRGRLETGALAPIARLDDRFEVSWNDPAVILDARDEALLAVEEMARRRGAAGLREILTRLAGSPDDEGSAFRSALGVDLDTIDAAWRSALAKRGS